MIRSVSELSFSARNSADWHRLLEICAFNDTLILDEDGIYNPGAFNDRLLLGLKGTMSEAELHVMRMRIIGGVLTKARRGELCPLLPIGFMYDEENKVVLDPDQQVQESIRLVFSLFRRTGSAYALVRHFRDKGTSVPIASSVRTESSRTDLGSVATEHDHARTQ